MPVLPKTSMFMSTQQANIASILREAEEIIDEAPFILGDAPSGVEPTPLGPQGVQRVVRNVPLSASNWHSDHMFSSLLAPLLRSGAKRTLPDRFSSSNFALEPTTKNHLASWYASGGLRPVEPIKMMHRASWCAPSSHPMKPNIARSSRKVDCDESDDEAKERFRAYQSEQWNERFDDLVVFRNKCGHCLVPHNLEENPPMAQWVKRQRYQFKLKLEKRHSTLTDERQTKLEAMGFIWDSHKAVWEEKYKTLCTFRMRHGHSNVPSKYEESRLAIWVKCQRRQYKLFLKGGRSAMNMERIVKLESIDFVWNPRNL